MGWRVEIVGLVIERNRRPVGTRTPDLYRVNNYLQDRGDCQSTRKSYKTYFLWVGLWVGNVRTECPAVRYREQVPIPVIS